MEAIPTAVGLTTNAGDSEELVEQIAAGTWQVQVGRTFHLDRIVDAHRCMEENKGGGKDVVPDIGFARVSDAQHLRTSFFTPFQYSNSAGA
jgi:Zinc-binding dehydrogenase